MEIKRRILKKNLAIILARKHSSRLKEKHLIIINSKPLIQYTFEYAKRSLALDDIVCSTDCSKIGDLAKLFGISVIKRPSKLAQDSSHIIDAIEYTLLQYQLKKGFLPATTTVLYGNVPYRGTTIEKGLEFFNRKNADSVFTACKVLKHHPEWMFRNDGNNRMIFERKSQNYRCQDLPLYYIVTDSFIISKTEKLLKKTPRKSLYSDFGDKIYFVEEEVGTTIDIDDIHDLNYFRFHVSGGDKGLY